MTLDEAILAAVEAKRRHLETLEDDVFEARADFHQSLRRLHSAGASMREIAAALGMSHQRVHQIIGEDEIVEVEAPPAELTQHPATPSVALTADEDACSFCGAPRREIERLLAAPGRVFICDSCVRVARKHSDAYDVATECSFCRRPTTAGFGTPDDPVICHKCLHVCERMLDAEATPPKRTAMRRSAKYRCSFCNASQSAVPKLIAGPDVYICDGCVTTARAVVSTGDPTIGPRQVGMRPATSEPDPCSFCGKHTPSITSMVQGGRARICNQCLDLCEDILKDEGYRRDR